MLSDDEILAVVQAHKEGKRIESKRFRGCDSPKPWATTPDPVWDFSIYDYRVAPEPRKPRELWLQECGEGLWQEKFKGLCSHFREVIE